MENDVSIKNVEEKNELLVCWITIWNSVKRKEKRRKKFKLNFQDEIEKLKNVSDIQRSIFFFNLNEVKYKSSKALNQIIEAHVKF